MAKKAAVKPELTKLDFLDVELGLLWGCLMNAQVPAQAAEVVVSLKQKMSGPVEAAMKRAQEQQGQE